MIAAVVLGLYAIIATVTLPKLLAQAQWAERAPRLAIAVWQAACVSVLTSPVLAILAAVVPASVVGHGLAGLFEACAEFLSDGPGLSSTAVGVALLAGATVAARISYCAAAVLLRARRGRQEHAEMLSVLGRHDRALGAVVVDHTEPMAYCLPGRQSRTVITTGALHSLTPDQVAAVLAHEQAHLRGRHHLVLAGAETLIRAFPHVPLFAQARVEIARLIELLADDVAARRHPRIHIAAALVRLATGRFPAFSLGAGGETALTRVRRMLHPADPLSRRERMAGLISVAVMVAGPAAVAAIPGVSAFLAHHCHRLFLL
jgi:Zn-dependent protease with chaperone function